VRKYYHISFTYDDEDGEETDARATTAEPTSTPADSTAGRQAVDPANRYSKHYERCFEH